MMTLEDKISSLESDFDRWSTKLAELDDLGPAVDKQILEATTDAYLSTHQDLSWLRELKARREGKATREFKVVRTYQDEQNSIVDLQAAFDEGWQFLRASESVLATKVDRSTFLYPYIEYILYRDINSFSNKG